MTSDCDKASLRLSHRNINFLLRIVERCDTDTATGFGWWRKSDDATICQFLDIDCESQSEVSKNRILRWKVPRLCKAFHKPALEHSQMKHVP